MKLISWNVNGLRAIAKKDFFKDVEEMNPDILCLQETKAQNDQVAEVMHSTKNNELFLYSSSAIKKGYSGTAIISKTEARAFSEGIGEEEHDQEGRVLTLEYPAFYLVNVYVPNAGNELKRLDYRQRWDLAFYQYLKKLEQSKPVIVCGDFNVAHKEIDLARPKANYNKSPGFTQKEIDGMDRFTEGGFCDTFRHFYPEERDRYSWWSYRAGARAKNVGWRIDYFLVSQSFLPALSDAYILSEVMGSDHCPVGIHLKSQ
jgi:exodeoxyribonuclease-3